MTADKDPILGDYSDVIDMMIEEGNMALDEQTVLGRLNSDDKESYTKLKRLVDTSKKKENKEVLLKGLLKCGEKYFKEAMDYADSLGATLDDDLVLSMARNMFQHGFSNNIEDIIEKAIEITEKVEQRNPGKIKINDDVNLGIAAYRKAVKKTEINGLETVIKRLEKHPTDKIPKEILKIYANSLIVKGICEVNEDNFKKGLNEYRYDSMNVDLTVQLIEKLNKIDEYKSLIRISSFLLRSNSEDVKRKAKPYLQKAIEKKVSPDYLDRTADQLAGKDNEFAVKFYEKTFGLRGLDNFDSNADIAIKMLKTAERKKAGEYLEAAISKTRIEKDLERGAAIALDNHLEETAEKYYNTIITAFNKDFKFCETVARKFLDKRKLNIAERYLDFCSQNTKNFEEYITLWHSFFIYFKYNDKEVKERLHNSVERFGTANAEILLSYVEKGFGQEASEDIFKIVEGKEKDVARLAAIALESKLARPAEKYYDEMFKDPTKRDYATCKKVGDFFLKAKNNGTALKYYSLAAESAKTFDEYYILFEPLLENSNFDVSKYILLQGLEKHYDAKEENYKKALDYVAVKYGTMHAVDMGQDIRSRTPEIGKKFNELLERYKYMPGQPKQAPLPPTKEEKYGSPKDVDLGNAVLEQLGNADLGKATLEQLGKSEPSRVIDSRSRYFTPGEDPSIVPAVRSSNPKRMDFIDEFMKGPKKGKLD